MENKVYNIISKKKAKEVQRSNLIILIGICISIYLIVCYVDVVANQLRGGTTKSWNIIYRMVEWGVEKWAK